MKDKFKKINADKLLFAMELIMLFAIIMIFTTDYTDTDLYYLLANGKYILKHGIPHTNPFVFAPFKGGSLPDIVIQNWLYCVIVAGVSKLAGSLGLCILELTFIIGMMFTMHTFLKIRGSNWNKTLTLIVLAITLICFGYINLRPQMFTFILIMTEIICIEKVIKTGNTKYLFIIPLCTLIEINIHASYWIMHYVVFFPYMIPMKKIFKDKIPNSLCDNFKKKQYKPIFITWLMMAVSLFINPYGADSILYVFKALHDNVFGFITIVEQQPLSFGKPTIELFLIFIVVFVIFIAMIYKKRIKFSTIFMYLGFTLLISLQIKWLSFYVIGILFVLSDFIKYLETTKLKEVKISLAYKWFYIGCTFMMAVLFLLIVITTVVSTKEFKPTEEALNTPNATISKDEIKIAEYLKIHNADRVFTQWDSGNYYEYKGIKVLVDARPELYTIAYSGTNDYDETNLGIQSHIECGLPAYSVTQKGITTNTSLIRKIDTADEYGKLVDKLDTKYYVVQATTDALYKYVTGHPEKYKLVYKGKNQYLYEKL